MPRKKITLEIAVNAAIEVFIATRANLTEVNIYMPPEAAAVEMRKMNVEVSSVTIGKRYIANGITFDPRLGLWTKSANG